MTITRRDLLKTGAAMTAIAALPDRSWAQANGFAPKPGTWRQFEVTARLEIVKPEGKVQAWIPVPSVNEADWFASGESTWTGNGTAALKRDARYNAGFVHVEWDGVEKPAIEVRSRIKTQDRSVDLDKPGKTASLSDADRKLFTAATVLIPTTGIVKETSDRIVGNAGTDIDKAKRIF